MVRAKEVRVEAGSKMIPYTCIERDVSISGRSVVLEPYNYVEIKVMV